MTHMRYWAMSLATAVCGAFIAIERFAFDPGTAVWIAFGVAIGAGAFSLMAFAAALARSNHVFSGVSDANVVIAAFTIVAMLVFSTATAVWIAFAAGIMMLMLAVRALALHETTVERVVYALESGVPLAAMAPDQALARPEPVATARPRAGARMPFTIGAPMRSWVYWLTHTSIAVAGAFVVAVTFAFSAPASAASPRWLAFGIAVATACLAFATLIERALTRDDRAASDGGPRARLAEMLVTGASGLTSVAIIVTMVAVSAGNARWVAFALACGLTGISLLAGLIHEVMSERVRHELEIAEPARSAAVADTLAGAIA